MGNYMEACIERKQVQQENQQQQQEEITTSDETFSKESSSPVRVKLVLTKEELQWLLLQLKKDEGRKLEQVLEEIETSRLTGESVTKWRPCLESIMESPEIHHYMDRST